jgi:hypothetical protein
MKYDSTKIQVPFRPKTPPLLTSVRRCPSCSAVRACGRRCHGTGVGLAERLHLLSLLVVAEVVEDGSRVLVRVDDFQHLREGEENMVEEGVDDFQNQERGWMG